MTDEMHPVAREQPPFASHLGVRMISATPEKAVSEMFIGPDLINHNGMLHGGAIMALADNLAGTLAFVNLGPGEGTTTMESKTNFFRPVLPEDTVRAEAVMLHQGRKTMVLQTSIFRGDGKLAAIVIQTQMRLKPGD